MRSEVGRIDTQIKRLVDAILEGADAKPISIKLKELEAEEVQLTAALDATPDSKPLLDPNLAAIYRSSRRNP
jgi:hypothetical protein